VQHLRPWLGAIRVVSGLFLVALGILVVLNRLQGVSAFAFRAASALQEWNARDVMGPRVLFGSLLAGLAIPFLWSAVRSIIMKRKTPVIRAVFFATFAILSALTFCGVIDAVQAVSRWLTFQGL
jgi:hypothetical protein